MEIDLRELIDLVASHASAEPPKHSQEVPQIVILQRGFVVVGWVSHCGEMVHVSGGHFIRRWGTSKGLGELKNGPLAETVLDPVDELQVHRLGVVAFIDVDGGAWQCKLRT